MANIVGKNVYFDLEEANEIVMNNFEEDDEEYIVWNKMSDAQKETLIRKNTLKVNSFEYLGINRAQSNMLKWPRIIDYTFIECPYNVKLFILKNGLTDKVNKESEEIKLQKQNVSSYSIEGASIKFEASTKIESNGVYNKHLHLISNYLIGG